MNQRVVDSALSTLVLRAALGRFATGVTIVSCRAADGSPVGLTANSFNSLSLQPPLILWSLRSVSPNLDAFLAASHFAVNVLAENQVELSRRFASPVPDKFAEGLWAEGLGGAPVLAGCAAVFECEQVSLADGRRPRAVHRPGASRQRGAGHAAGVPVGPLPHAGRDPLRRRRARGACARS